MDGSSPDPVLAAYREGFVEGHRLGFETAVRIFNVEPKQIHIDQTHPAACTDAYKHPPSVIAPTFVPPAEWIPLRHTGNGGDPHQLPIPCGEVSHYLTERVAWGEKVSTEKLRKLDGTEPRTSERPVCGRCDDPINPWSGHFLDYSDAFIPETLPKPPKKSRKKVEPVDEITQALAKLEADLVKSSQPKPLDRICVLCGEAAHNPPCKPTDQP